MLVSGFGATAATSFDWLVLEQPDIAAQQARIAKYRPGLQLLVSIQTKEARPISLSLLMFIGSVLWRHDPDWLEISSQRCSREGESVGVLVHIPPRLSPIRRSTETRMQA